MVPLTAWFSVSLIALGFAATVYRATSLGMPTQMPMWVVMVIPSALSEVVFDDDNRYTVLKPVYQEYYSRLATNLDAASVNAAISAVMRLDPNHIDRGYELLWDDDKGMVDFVALAFRLFGFQVQSIFYLYFLVMLASCIAYTLAFFKQTACLLLLAGFVSMFFLLLPMIAFNPQLVSVLTNRVLPLLSVVACLHLILFALRPRLTVVQLALVFAQAVLLIFTVHLRTTTMWQTTTVALVSGAAALLVWRRGVAHGVASAVWRPGALLASVPLVLVVVGQLGLQAYRSRAYAQEYYTGNHMVTRVIWHSLFSGLAFDPQFAERYDIRLDDFSVVRALRQYWKNRAAATNLLPSCQGRHSHQAFTGARTTSWCGRCSSAGAVHNQRTAFLPWPTTSRCHSQVTSPGSTGCKPFRPTSTSGYRRRPLMGGQSLPSRPRQ